MVVLSESYLQHLEHKAIAEALNTIFTQKSAYAQKSASLELAPPF